VTMLSEFNLHDSVWKIITTEGASTLQVAPWHEFQWVRLDLVPQLLLLLGGTACSQIFGLLMFCPCSSGS
jgi:hypothetical protein